MSDSPSSTSPRLVILADDLTGAADSAARATRAGLTATVLFKPDAWRSVSTDVVALTSDSRHLAPDEAAARVESIARVLADGGIQHIYKKIDSTLRGNIGVELDALMTVLSDAISGVVICPAFPDQGRGLADGLLVHGGTARQTPNLSQMMVEQSEFSTEMIGLATVRRGHSALGRALQTARTEGAKLLVVDAMTNEDLQTIVAASVDRDLLLCGSAGLVMPLAQQLAPDQADRVEPPTIPPGAILTIVGSGSPMAHRQVDHLSAAGVRTRMVDDSWYGLDLIGAEAHPVGDWLIHLAPPQAGTKLEGPAARSKAAQLAGMARLAVQRLHPSTLIIVGGDTAHFTLRALGITELEIVVELQPGIPLARGTDRAGKPCYVVLKPGNFGDAETLVALRDALRGLMSG